MPDPISAVAQVKVAIPLKHFFVIGRNAKRT
jgi:hypothetical protein